ASQDRLQAVLAEPAFRKKVEELLAEQREAAIKPGWFQNAYAGSPLSLVAYFSMEYMLSEALPIYSGGLGNVPGDQLKAASDLGVPGVGMGLLYQQGYFRQEIDANGSQEALFPFNDPGQLPIRPVRDAHGEWLRLSVPTPGLKVWIRAWQVRVGRITSIFSTQTIRRTLLQFAVLRATFMVVGRRRAFARNSCWESVDGDC